MPSPSFPRAGRPVLNHATAAYLILHVAGVVTTTLLLTWGLFLLFFLIVSGLSFDGLMHQLANLTGRYVMADAERIARFKTMLIGAHLLLSTAILFLRRTTLLPVCSMTGRN